MPNSQNQENTDSEEDGQHGFGIGQAFSAAAASLRAAGSRAQELVEGTTNAVLSSLPLNCIRSTDPGSLNNNAVSAVNNNVAIENQPENNELALANTQSETKLSIKGSCVIENELTEETSKGTEHFKAPAMPAAETTNGQESTSESELPNNNFFKRSSIVKPNLQLEQAKKTTKGTENLKAPAVQTPAGQSELLDIDFLKGCFIIRSNIKPKLAEETARACENLKVQPVAQPASGHSELPYTSFFKRFSSIKTSLHLTQKAEETAKEPEQLETQETARACENLKVQPVAQLASGHSELPYTTFFKRFSSIKTSLHLTQKAEETAKEPEQLETPTAQTTASQPESSLQLQTSTEKAGTSVELVDHVQSNLQSTGIQTEEKKGSVVKTLKAQRQITRRNAGLITHVTKTRRLDIHTQEETAPFVFTKRRLSNLACQVSPSSQTRQYLIDTSKTKRIVISRQPESTFDFKTVRRRSNISQRTDINFMHRYYSSECESPPNVSISTSRKTCSHSRRSMLSMQPSFTSHKQRWESSSKLNDLSLHRRKSRRLSEVVEQRRWTPGTPKTILVSQDSPTEITERNVVLSISMPSVVPLRSENVRGRKLTTVTRATHTTPNEQTNKFVKVIKQFFGACYKRRR